MGCEASFLRTTVTVLVEHNAPPTLRLPDRSSGDFLLPFLRCTASRMENLRARAGEKSPLRYVDLMSVLAMLGCGPSGCASWSAPNVPAANVAPGHYLGMNCEALRLEKLRIGKRQTDLAPTLLPVEDEQKREQELSQLSGEIKAIEKVSAEQKCG